MFVVGNKAAKMAHRGVNMEMCAQVGVIGPDVVAEKAGNKNVLLACYGSAERAQEVFTALMAEYAGGPPGPDITPPLDGMRMPYTMRPRVYHMPED